MNLLNNYYNKFKKAFLFLFNDQGLNPFYKKITNELNN